MKLHWQASRCITEILVASYQTLQAGHHVRISKNVVGHIDLDNKSQKDLSSEL